MPGHRQGQAADEPDSILTVDDAGSGCSGSRSTPGLRPGFIKIDVPLDTHRHAIKQDLAAAIACFSQDSGTTPISEGVENVEDLRCLQRIGVRDAQGYLVARSGPPAPQADLSVIG